MRTKGTISRLTLAVLMATGAGCAAIEPLAIGDLPDCFDSNYDTRLDLFTLRNVMGQPVNQQCRLTVATGDHAGAGRRLEPGAYRVYLANGGGGGAGGTLQRPAGVSGGGRGGGGGGGAGAAESIVMVHLPAGTYKLTLGAGGPGGSACMKGTISFGGGPGWIGSPSNMVRVDSGALVAGTAGADTYTRPSRAQNELAAGKTDGHGGSGPGQASGGRGTAPATEGAAAEPARAGDGKRAAGQSSAGGATGTIAPSDKQSGVGGGGGATSLGHGGQGGGESQGQQSLAPQRGALGSGGGGGEGSLSECDPGAAGGHGYIALRRL